MSEAFLVLIGNWGFCSGTRGISIYRYHPDNGDLELLETLFEDIEAGQLYVDHRNLIVYAVNEIGNRRGENGGGGYISAFQIDPYTQRMRLLNEKETLAPYPAFICMDKTGKYLLVAHHSDNVYVTKIVRKADGSFSNQVISSDTPLVLFRILDDGGIGDICDVFHTGVESNMAISHQHSVIAGFGASVFFVCDKGLDQIYAFELDYKNERLVLRAKIATEKGSMPRYGVVHPRHDLLYVNFENKEYVSVYRYQQETGTLNFVSKTSALLPEHTGLQATGGTDILLRPDGSCLYAAMRGINMIAVFEVLDDGMLRLKQNISCGGVNPRGLCFSPDGKYLYSGNVMSKNVTLFLVLQDGTLRFAEKIFSAGSPSVIRFVACEIKEGC